MTINLLSYLVISSLYLFLAFILVSLPMFHTNDTRRRYYQFSCVVLFCSHAGALTCDQQHHENMVMLID
jgi:hypothetical protein